VRRARKKVPLPTAGLLNWPPSRGPMPDALRAKPKIVVPEIEIEFLPWTNGRPPAPPERVAPPPPPKKSATRRSGRYVSINPRLLRAHANAEREIDLRVWAQVSAVATLKPEQWDLIVGAEICRPKYRGRQKLKRSKPYANTRTHLPERALVFDLGYPLRATARVTIRPYATVIGRSKYGEMSVGYVLWQLARAYRQIYRRWRKFGVWGHAIGDLGFESLTIRDNVGHVSIGS